MSREDLTFTGERLHEDDALFGADLARHRAAYHHAIRMARDLGLERVLELGSGTGYGTAELAEALSRVVAIHRVSPLARARRSRARFVRADLGAMPLVRGGFDLVVSFQVIEHLRDPRPLLETIAGQLRPDGLALVTTPNRLESDGENPFHVHEYEAGELASLLREVFGEVEMHGVSAIGPARAFHEARMARIRRIVRLDPLRIRHRIPGWLVEPLFARMAVRVRRSIARDRGATPQVGLEHFPIEPIGPTGPTGVAHDPCLDLLACCRKPLA